MAVAATRSSQYERPVCNPVLYCLTASRASIHLSCRSSASESEREKLAQHFLHFSSIAIGRAAPFLQFGYQQEWLPFPPLCGSTSGSPSISLRPAAFPILPSPALESLFSVSRVEGKPRTFWLAAAMTVFSLAMLPGHLLEVGIRTTASIND